jgi:Xaa-Pro aminopeptidase
MHHQIKSLAQYTSDLMQKVLADIEVGCSEKDVMRMLKHQTHNKKELKFSFLTIVGSGPRSAHPHARATHKRIKRGEFIVVDFGFREKGVCSDITRTIVLGKPSSKQRKIYAVVRKAQLAALKIIKEGSRCCDVDKAARDVIKKAGYGKHFVHSTGHGIGRGVHQVPKIGPRNKRRLKAGMVITIEPGIYVKGYGGVRIEDMVLVTRKGYKLLTNVPYRLQIL